MNTENSDAPGKVPDTPLITSSLNPSYTIERKAIELYRAKYPDGVAWQDLHLNTRSMWIDYVTDNEKRR